jgi:hypothetical protein
MRPNPEQLKALHITPRAYEGLVRRGWIDAAGRSKVWFDWQDRDHDRQFEEEKERKAGPKKFVKEIR